MQHIMHLNAFYPTYWGNGRTALAVVMCDDDDDDDGDVYFALGSSKIPLDRNITHYFIVLLAEQ